METDEMKHLSSTLKNDEVNAISSENFQKFIYEVFEKNGVLNHLRAYLRSNIIDVLKTAQTDKPSICQRKFTQRLDLTYQALNMLIAEYLMRLEFSYSLSIFVSEIPLSNMAFEFAKSLLHITDDTDITKLRIPNKDVWSILNCLGVKCDSKDAMTIVDMYKSEGHMPLLLCILKCLMSYQNDSESELLTTSAASISSITKSDDHTETKRSSYFNKRRKSREKCHHIAYCRTCQCKMSQLKRKYNSRKKKFGQGTKHERTPDEKLFLKYVDDMDQCVFDEMFNQIKSVYETELEKIRENDENKVKRSLATHQIHLQKHRDEIEKSFKARELELERNIEKKKQFVWGLAQSLRDQHSNIQRAMKAIRIQAEKLSNKEENIKSQMEEAEGHLNQRAIELRSEISKELNSLTDHVEALKIERDRMNKEREELENMKTIKPESDYDMLKSELQTIKNLIEVVQVKPKSLVETGSVTEYNLMNNEQAKERSDKKTPHRLVNNLSKKNVNFNQTMLDDLGSRSLSTLASDTELRKDSITKLREENTRLASFAELQQSYIEGLTCERARLHAELTSMRFSTSQPAAPLWRPRTAPTVMPSMLPLTTTGAGEASRDVTHALHPAGSVPFVHKHDRHNYKRYLLEQWRSLRYHSTPPGGTQLYHVQEKSTHPTLNPCQTSQELQMQKDNAAMAFKMNSPMKSVEVAKSGVTSPKRLLREAKEKLRRKNNIVSQSSRDKSPNAILREARLRLRKLEIEAEAVEKSYKLFKRKQSASKRDNYLAGSVADVKLMNEFDMNLLSEQRYKNIPLTTCSNSTEMHNTGNEFEKYLQACRPINFDGDFGNKTAENNEVDAKDKNETNYLDTPLYKFRKLYHHGESSKSKDNGAYLDSQIMKNSETMHNELHNSSLTPKLNKETERNMLDAHDNIDVRVNSNRNAYKSPVSEFDTNYTISPRNQTPQEKSEIDLNDTFKDDAPSPKIEPERQSEDIFKNKDVNSPRKKWSKASDTGRRTNDIFDIEKSNLELAQRSFNKLPEQNSDIDDNASVNQIYSNQTIIIQESNLELAENENFLRVEIDTVGNVSSLQLTNAKDDVLVVVHSTPKTGEQELIDSEDRYFGMLVSPNKKKIQTPNILEKTFKDEVGESDETRLNEPVQELVEEENAIDYPDDFSADVDNYDFHSDNDLHSPVSLPKSEDENFWDS